MDKLILIASILLAELSCVICNHDYKEDLFSGPGLVWIEDMNGTMVFQYIHLTNELWRKKTFPEPSRIALALPNRNRFTHLDVDIGNQTMVMVDSLGQKIVARTFDSLGLSIEWDLYEGISKKVNGIAVDWVTDVVYWTDDAYDVILAVSMYSPNMAVVIVDSQIDEPYGIVTFPGRGFLFWTDIDPKNPRVMRSTLGGRRVKQLCRFRRTSRRPMSLFIDYAEERLYWIYEDNIGLKGIGSCDLDGKDLKHLQKAVISKHFDIGVFVNQLLYIDDGKINIYQMDRLNSGPESRSSGSPLTMVFIDKDRQYQKPNGCLLSGCPGVCTMSTYTEDCFCSALLEDRVDPEVIDRHCSESAFSGLLFPKGDGIYTIKPNFIERGPRSTLSQAKPVKILSTKFPVKAVASDVRKMKMFFYEYSTNVIKSLSTLENSEPEVVSLAVGEVGGIAFDGNHLYWTDMEYGHIMVVREDGTFPHILHRDLGQPKALALHPQRRVMIWSELATGTLTWSYLDGSSKTQINMMTTYQIRDIAIDFSSGSEVRMYLCDDSAVYETDKGGSFFIIHYRKTFRHRFTGMTILHDYLVLTDAKLKSSGLHVFDRKVFDKDGRIRKVGESLFPFYKYGNWYGARNHHISNQPKNKLDICRVKRAKCEHLCLPGSRSYTCVCSTGYKKNDSACIIDEPYTTFIFVSDMRYSKLLQIPDVTRQFVAVPAQGLHQPYSLAYDPVYKMVYWSDLETGTISRSFMNGTNQEVIKYDPHAYFIGLFIEPGSRLLLYMVRNKPEFDIYRQPIGSLVAMNIDTMKSAILLKRALGAPHSVTVNVKHGYIYMTEQRNIWRINLGNFTDFICLASQVLSTMVTTADDYVYFVNEIPVETYYEPKKTQIVRFGIDGENMTALFDLKGGTVYDLAVDKYFIYWINGSTRSVQRVNLDNYDVIEDVGPSKSLFKPTSLYVSPTEYNYDSVCTNFECKGVCLPALTEAVCEENSVSEIVEVHNDSALCVIPDIKYGDILHNQAGRVVPRGYTATVQCFPAHAVTGSATITCLGGVWSDTPTCNLEYSICGTPKKGYKVYRESGSFFVYPGATLLAVICIGGGGGGYDVKNDVIVRSGKAGDGGDSSFGSHLNAFGGTGGSVNEGGKGGKGHMDGGPGSAGSNCTTGGTAGVGQITPDTGEPDYSAELFCGTGGFSHECTSIPETLDEYAGPGGRDGNGSFAGNFGGGAGRREGGSGGGGGWSSLTFSLPEKELVPVTVGEAGFPSYGTPAPGLVVVSWGDFRIDRFAKSYDIINECVLGDVDYEL